MDQHICTVCYQADCMHMKISDRQKTKSSWSTHLCCPDQDYCNSILTGLPATQIAHLQRITKHCCQTCPPKIKQLHWLLLQTQIDYKLATLAFWHFDGSLPHYLSSMLDIYQPSQSLRSSNDKHLRVPHWKLKSLGTGLSATKHLLFGTPFPLILNSLLTWLHLNPN